MKWLAELDSDEFEVREKAALDLKRGGRCDLIPGKSTRWYGVRRGQAANASNSGGDQGKSGPIVHPEWLRTIRALEVLENINDEGSRKLVDALSEGEPAAWLTKEAKAVRDRMLKRPLSKP